MSRILRLSRGAATVVFLGLTTLALPALGASTSAVAINCHSLKRMAALYPRKSRGPSA